MIRLALFLPLAIAGCSVGHKFSPAADPSAGPSFQNVDLQGRWEITAVNGRPAMGLWLELGREGLGSVVTRDHAIFVASPQPRTRAHLGCNDWRLNGWVRTGAELRLGTEMSSMTERGCDAATTALEEAAYSILRQSMAMEFAPPDRLRLSNGNGSLELVRVEDARVSTAAPV